MNHFRLFRNRFADSMNIHIVIRHRNFFIDDADINQRARHFYRVSDDRLHGIIRDARCPYYLIPGTEIAQHGHSKRMSARDKLGPHQRCFRMKNVGINFV